MYLIIDSTQKEALFTGIADSRGKLLHVEKEKVAFTESERLLEVMQRVLKKNRIPLKKLSGIVVAQGPGSSFTALRIGVTVANALAWSLKLPLSGIKAGEYENFHELAERGVAKLQIHSGRKRTNEILTPEYGSPPRITVKKK